MSIEIERRFLVSGEAWRKLIKKAENFRQGYLTTGVENWTVRIRIIENKSALLTIKSAAEGIARHEFEYPISLDDAESIWSLVKHKLIKTRYEINLSGGKWVVDCFKGENEPLILAEVELPSIETLIEQPEWCIEEITGQNQWSNASLAKKSLLDWPIKDRQATE